MKKVMKAGAVFGLVLMIIWFLRAPQADTREIRRRQQGR